MAFYGNDMFGHHMQLAAAQASSGGFGSNTFGQGSHSAGFNRKGGFGQGMGCSGFGNSRGMIHDPHTMYLKAHSNPEYMQNLGNHGMFMRQNSMLSEMTQTKSDREKRPFKSMFSSPYGQGAVTGMLANSIYEKPCEKANKKQMLQRQSSFMEDQPDSPGDLTRRRPPSFSSDPSKFRSRTISTSSMPTPTTTRASRPQLMRSISINEDITEPANMDIAGPMLRRQQSLDAEKAKKRLLPKKSLLPHGLGRRKKAFKLGSASVSDCNSSTGLNSETSSVQLMSMRSRSNTNDSERSTTDTVSMKEASPVQSVKNIHCDNDIGNDIGNHTYHDNDKENEQDQEKLILSLMNPVHPLDQETNDIINAGRMYPVIDTYDTPQSPSRGSPSMVRKRVQELEEKNKENHKDTDFERFVNSPRSKAGSKASSTPRRSRSPTASLPGHGVAVPSPGSSIGTQDWYPDLNDSDMSDVYYECSQSHRSSLSSLNADNPMALQNRKRSMRRQRMRNSASTCTDGDDTTSTCDTPPRPDFHNGKVNDLANNNRMMYLPVTDRGSPTTKIRDKGLHPSQPHVELSDQELNRNGINKQKPKLKRLVNNGSYSTFTKTVMHTPETEPLLKPVFANPIHAEGDPRDHHNEPGTAESSESGYATSHKPLSPKDYHLKVSQFVNSLPNNPDIDERHSEPDNDVLNGSMSDIDNDEGHRGSRFGPGSGPGQLDLASVSCVSGSDTDDNGPYVSDGDSISTSKLEVMKLLESPTEVRERVSEEMSKIKDIEGKLPSPTYLFRKDITDAPLKDVGETEVLKPVSQARPDALRPEMFKDIQSDPEEVKVVENAQTVTQKPPEKHVEVNCVVVSRQESTRSERSETRAMKRSAPSTGSNFATMFDKFNVGRQISSVYNSNTSGCLDMLLHFLNFLLFVSSAGVIGLSIWLLLKDFNVNDATIILGNNLLQIIIYVAISGAGVAMLAAFCLCCGIRQDRTGLGFYACVLIGVVIAFAVSAILTTIFSDKLQGIEFKFNFKDRLETMYGVANNQDSKQLTKAWDVMQKQFECCGGEGNENDTQSWALYRKSTWFRSHPKKGLIFVPESCCRKNSNIEVCQGGDHDLLGPPRYAPPLNKYYPKRNPYLHTNGCYTFFSSYLNELALYIAIATGSLAGLYSLTVLLSWIFCFKHKKDYYNEDDSSYYDFDDEHDDVFIEQPGGKTEETRFITTNPNHPSNLKKHTRGGSNSSHNHVVDENTRYVAREYSNHVRGVHDYRRRDNNRSYDDDDDDGESHSGSSDSGGDEDTVSNLSSPEEQSARRNMWLNSGHTAGHLLSMAIEEEDSNYEDSDDENVRPNQHAYV